MSALEQRLADLKAARAEQCRILAKDHSKAELAGIIVAGRISHAERDIVQRDLYEALEKARQHIAVTTGTEIMTSQLYAEIKAALAKANPPGQGE